MLLVELPGHLVSECPGKVIILKQFCNVMMSPQQLALVHWLNPLKTRSWHGLNRRLGARVPVERRWFLRGRLLFFCCIQLRSATHCLRTFSLCLLAKSGNITEYLTGAIEKVLVIPLLDTAHTKQPPHTAHRNEIPGWRNSLLSRHKAYWCLTFLWRTWQYKR